MEQFKGTKKIVIDCTKKAMADYPDQLPIYSEDGHLILLVNHKDGEISTDEYSDNVKLIEDAFIVRQQINFDLPELLEQRNQMLEMLNRVNEKLLRLGGERTPLRIEIENLIKKSTNAKQG